MSQLKLSEEQAIKIGFKKWDLEIDTGLIMTIKENETLRACLCYSNKHEQWWIGFGKTPAAYNRARDEDKKDLGVELEIQKVEELFLLLRVMKVEFNPLD